MIAHKTDGELPALWHRRVDRFAVKVRFEVVKRQISHGLAGLAGALFAFSKGSISPEVLGVSKSVDGLVMVLLGGVHTLVGPLVGAITFTALQDNLARNTDYWRAVLGASMLLMVLVFSQGIAGSLQALWLRVRDARTTNERGTT